MTATEQPVETFSSPFRTTSTAIVELIRKMGSGGSDELVAHARTLLGPRTRGSTTVKGLDELETVIEFEDRTDDVHIPARVAGCTYLRGTAPEEMGARLGAMTEFALRERLEGIDPALIKERRGPHGRELYLDRWPREVELPVATEVWVVVGRPNEFDGFPNGVVYTWHPGEPMAHLKGTDDPCAWTAVKLHNGAPDVDYCAHCCKTDKWAAAAAVYVKHLKPEEQIDVLERLRRITDDGRSAEWHIDRLMDAVQRAM